VHLVQYVAAFVVAQCPGVNVMIIILNDISRHFFRKQRLCTFFCPNEI
jgi:hypothetical protein